MPRGRPGVNVGGALAGAPSVMAEGDSAAATRQVLRESHGGLPRMGSMSQSASWAYTSHATHWPLSGRDDLTGALVFGAPVVFDCDYKAEALRMTDSRGQEFTTRQVIYTERAVIKAGDRVLIGEHTDASPLTVAALEVRSVTRYADTFDGVADDYMVGA
jgi:hypothetical protein